MTTGTISNCLERKNTQWVHFFLKARQVCFECIAVSSRCHSMEETSLQNVCSQRGIETWYSLHSLACFSLECLQTCTNNAWVHVCVFQMLHSVMIYSILMWGWYEPEKIGRSTGCRRPTAPLANFISYYHAGISLENLLSILCYHFKIKPTLKIY